MGATNSKNRTPKQTASMTLRIIGIPFAIIGLIIIIIFALLIHNESRYDDKYDMVSAQIVEITSHRDSDGDISHTAFVAYEHDGHSYDYIMLSSYTSSMRKGRTITLYIDPSDPTHPKYKMGVGFYIVFVTMGVIFAAVGFGLLIGSSSNTKKRLVDNGQGEAVYATVVGAGKTNVRVNGSMTYRITATWDDQYGVTHEYKSELLYFDPSMYISAGELIRVYVDPDNYKKYYMCAAELQSEDPEYQMYRGG